MNSRQPRLDRLERRYRRLRQHVAGTLALGVVVLPVALRELGVSDDPWRNLQFGVLGALVCFVAANWFWDWRDARDAARERQHDLQHSSKEPNQS